jgi:NAD(P)-dependent dehydrogenase (short-subunit alcohol dehydrogenase family)
MDFKNKNILITGASRGIGKATALSFAKKGAKVGINYRSNTEEAEKTLAELSGEGHQLFQQDISEKDGPEALIKAFVNNYGQLDVLVNNAGISIFHKIDKPFF